MASLFTRNQVLNAFAQATQALNERKEEVNRLNVFPVPDGDTGTNMSLTMDSVMKNLGALPSDASLDDIRKAITTGALMGARGNSGVITSQILRGLCEGSVSCEQFDSQSVSKAFQRSQEVAFQAVRKPVEGTILTVLKDCAAAAKRCAKKKMELADTLSAITEEAFASVQRTPEFLPVLAENGVVDAGGFGIAILFEAFVSSLLGKDDFPEVDLTFASNAPKVAIEGINDWAGSSFRYCTEFLVHSDTLDIEAAKEFLPTMGDCDLLVGSHPHFKVHVHSDRPDQVLAYFITHDAQVSEVHVHNMVIQSGERTEKLEAEASQSCKPYALVAVAVGEGNADILRNMGVDVVVSGGQTMNPSTQDLYDAAASVHCEKAIFLPNNKNIVMAAQSAVDLLEIPAAVVPTHSLPECFSALFAFDEQLELDENVEAMTEAYQEVRTAEITYAIKDSKDAHGNHIGQGDVIGITQGSIEVVGSDIIEVAMHLLDFLEAENFDMLTVLAGQDFSDEQLASLLASVEESYPDLEADAHRGGQPLYPLIISIE